MNRETWLKIVLPAAIALSIGVGGAGWRQSVMNEHRVTVVESAASYLAKAVDSTIARQLVVEQKFDAMLGSMGRIEGAITERNRNEQLTHGRKQ